MKYRIWFEPQDIEADDFSKAQWLAEQEGFTPKPTVSKILPIDEDGFPIEQPKIIK